MKRTSLRLALALIAVVAAGATACDRNKDTGGTVSGPSTTAASVAEGTVVIQNLSFNPARVTTKVGKEVVWSFKDNGLNHTVSADDGSFDSGREGSGEFKRAFNKPGEVAYHCNVHARMKGTVVVTS